MYQSTMVSQPEDGPPEVSELDGYKFTRKNGSLVIEGGEQGPRIPSKGDHDENLAELMDEAELTQIAARLIEYYDTDKESRADWEKTEGKALEMMGVKEIPDDSEFTPGLHRVVHPLLADAAVNFQARSIVELFPDSGPVKTRMFGNEDQKKRDQAKRIENYGNYYLTEVDDGYYNDTDQMLMYLPLAGSAFRKCGVDWTTGMPELRYVKATHFIAPYNGSTLKKMSRYCHEYTLLGQDIDRAIELRMFRDAGLVKAPAASGGNSATEDKSDGRTHSIHEDDDPHTIYEYHCTLGVSFDGQPDAEIDRVLPYIIIVDRESQKVLMVRRNWKEGDSKRRKRVWFAHHKFLQGLGFYGWGYVHVIGSLLKAASGSVNALLDSAFAANFQGGFKTKEGRAVGDVSLEHGVWKDVEATMEDLSKSFYTPPFREPSAALFQLLEGLVRAGQRFTSTTEVAVGDADNTGPVGTTIALIEESQRVMSAIHKRLHKSLGQELKMWAEMVYDVMPSSYEYEAEGETRTLLRKDFDGRVDIVPVTNPNIASNTQRLATTQLVLESQANNPDLFSRAKRVAAIRRMWEAAKVQDIDEIAPDDDKPLYLDPVAESGLMTVGKAVRAFEYQDHAAHIAVHQNALQWAQTTMDPESFDRYAGVAMAHLHEHMALQYRLMVYQSAGIHPPPLGADGMPQQLDPETEAMVSQAVVRALPPPPPPPSQENEGQPIIDKAQAAIQAKDMDIKAKIERDTESFVADQKRRETEHQENMRRLREQAAAEESRKDQLTATEIIRGKARAQAEVQIQRAKGALGNAITANAAKTKADAAKKTVKNKPDL